MDNLSRTLFGTQQQSRDNDYDRISDVSSIQGGGEVQMNSEAVYGNDEAVDKIANPRTGRLFMAFNLIAMIVLVVIIALKADINAIYSEVKTIAKSSNTVPKKTDTTTAKGTTVITGNTAQPKTGTSSSSSNTASNTQTANKAATTTNGGAAKTNTDTTT